MKDSWQEAVSVLKKNGVAVIPTDTIYGIVGSALSQKTVERIYKLKGRDDHKPCIILITSYKDLDLFGVSTFRAGFWPGKVSVELPYLNKKSQTKFRYLNRGTHANSFRMVGPKHKNLFNLIKKAGPLIAPSANPQGLLPASNIREAKKYFADKVDVYVSAGTKRSKPSTLVSYKDGTLQVLRQGVVTIK
jgi:L-threonylcarbamoyladenylate synthase